MTELPRRSSPWRSLNAWESVSEAGGPPVALPLQTKDTSAKVDATGPMRNGGVGGQKRASHGVTFISIETLKVVSATDSAISTSKNVVFARSSSLSHLRLQVAHTVSKSRTK